MNSEPSSSAPPPDRPLLHGVDWAVRAGVTEEVMLGARQRVRQRRRRIAVAGTMAACVVVAAFWVAKFSTAPTATPAAPPSVVVTVPARQTLSDGTVVELRRGAQISVAYSAAVRRVALLRGEAHFEVTKDVTRPFVVMVDSVAVRAVGTAFVVQRRESEVEVLVTHGTVAVDRVPEAGANPAAAQTIVMLDAGNRTLVGVASPGEAPAVEPVTPIEMSSRLAWRTARLEFTRTPLAEAIPMINEHSAVKISLADDSIGQVRISGLLSADNVESLFRLLEVEHGIRVEQKSPTEVVLRK